MSIIREYAGLSDEEKLFIAGVLYLDNRRLRRLCSKLAMRHFDMPDCVPFLPGELEDLSGIVANYAEDVGVEDALVDRLRKVRWPARARTRTHSRKNRAEV